MMNRYIPLSVPNFEGNEKKYVNDAVEQAWVSTGGAYITQLEHQIAEYLHVNNVAACQSGTSAIHLSLIEAGVKPEDVVIVPALTFIAAVNPVRYQYAIPVFMDCDDSLCMDPNKLKEFCEQECQFANGKLTFREKHIKAIIVVHIFGNMADMVSILSVARKYNLQVIEDATEALGTCYVDGEFKGHFAGTIGDFGAFSFNGNKIITTGGGGAVTARVPEIVDHLRYLSTQAKDDAHYYIHNEVGYNYRMTNVQAAMGVAQMEMLPEFVMRKQKNYNKYKKQFEGFTLCRLLEFRESISSNKWFYSLEIDRARVKVPLREIISLLDEKGIQTRAIWGLINDQLPYKGEYAYKIKKAPYYAEHIINIPSSTNIRDEEIIFVSEQIKKTLEDLSDD